MWHGYGLLEQDKVYLGAEKAVNNMHRFKGARTYCIINEAMPSSVVAMDYFS